MRQTELPEPCAECAPFNGNWRETESGLARCKCPRGLALRDAARLAVPRSPVISEEFAMVCVEFMSQMDFFPPEAGARGAIASEIADICPSEKTAKWLAKRMNRLYQKWPGVIEMRRVFCDGYGRPLDGVDAIGISSFYPDGFPSEYPEPESAPQLLASGEPDRERVSAADSLNDFVHDVAKTKAMAPVRRQPVREIPQVQLTDANRITEADIEKARQEYRERKAREERAEEAQDGQSTATGM